MPRAISTVLLLALLAATAVAFVVTEGLKLEPSPIARVEVTKLFSPERHSAVVRFRLRKKDHVTLSIVDADANQVRTLLASAARKKGTLRVTWDGRDDAGAIVPDGVYRPRVHLQHQHRTIVLPSTMRVDTTPPVVKALHVAPRVVEPGHRTVVRYRLSERAHVAIFVDGRRVVLGYRSRTASKLDWYGRVAHRDYAPGRYVLTLGATDLAGNRSRPSRGVAILVPLWIVTPVAHATTGSSFTVRLQTDRRPYRWKLAGHGGVSRRRALVLRAPDVPGRYALVIRQHGVHRAVVVKVS